VGGGQRDYGRNQIRRPWHRGLGIVREQIERGCRMSLSFRLTKCLRRCVGAVRGGENHINLERHASHVTAAIRIRHLIPSIPYRIILT
jgi:hypothetical protein